MVLGIYGAGGFGREMLELAKQINNDKKRWHKIVFIDDMKTSEYLSFTEVRTFEEINKEYDIDSIECIIAVGEPNVRKLLREKLELHGYRLTILVHPSVYIPENTMIGLGSIICYNCFISCNVTIGRNVVCQPAVSIGHDNKIGDDTVLSTYVCVAGGCTIGNETYIGLSVPIKESISIGSQSIIGMGSVVVRDIPDNVVAIGNPARAMKSNDDNRVFHKRNEEVK